MCRKKFNIGIFDHANSFIFKDRQRRRMKLFFAWVQVPTSVRVKLKRKFFFEGKNNSKTAAFIPTHKSLSTGNTKLTQLTNRSNSLCFLFSVYKITDLTFMKN